MGSMRDPWLERREFVEFILKERSRNGVAFIVPPGVPLTEPSLVDNLSPSLLIRQLSAGNKVDLTRCIVPDYMRRAAQLQQLPTAASSASAAAAANGHGAGQVNQHSSRDVGANPVLKPQGPPAPSNGNPFLVPPTGSSPSFNNPFEDAPPRPQPPTVPAPLPPRSSVSRPVPQAASHIQSAPSFAGATLAYSRPKETGAAQRLSEGSNGGGGSGRLGGLEHEGVLAAVAEAPSGPQLNLPQLDSGVSSDQFKELAYVTLCACCKATPADLNSPLLNVFRRQLELTEDRSRDTDRMMRHVPASWKPSQRATLELIVTLLENVRPNDFQSRSPFTAFLRWRDTLTAALDRCFSRNVAEFWTAGDPALSCKLMARLKGSIRRLDVRVEAEFDEEDYAEAVGALSTTARNLTGCCRSGWKYTWGMRVRLGEVFLQAMFETADGDESCYIDESIQAGVLLERSVWPLLSISPLLQLAINTWVHFRQYVMFEDPKLLRQVKVLMAKLAAEVSKKPAASDHFGLGQDVVGTDATHEEMKQDMVLAEQVGNQVIEFALERLRDYYVAFPKGNGIQGILDILVSASRSRGNNDNQLAELLVGVIRNATEAEYSRRIRAVLRGDESAEMTLTTMLQLATTLREDNEAVYCRPMSVHLTTDGAAEAVCCMQMYRVLHARMQPWLDSVSQVNDSTCSVFQLALSVDYDLMVTVEELKARVAGSWGDGVAGAKGVANTGEEAAAPIAVVDAINSCQRWDITAALLRVLTAWAHMQVSNMDTWTTRQLQSETWKAVTPGKAGHTMFAVEVSKLVLDTLESLFAMGLPTPKAVVVLLMDGIDGRLLKCARFMRDKMGLLSTLLPPVPELIRYKKSVVAKQEKAEIDMDRLGPVLAAKKGLKVLDSVPKIETSASYTHINSSLTSSVLAACIHSAHFLLDRTDLFIETASQRWHSSCKRFSHPVQQQQQQVDGPPTKADPLPGQLLSPSRAMLHDTLEYGCAFLATKITFWDLREQWLEQLYRHHVQPRALDAIVERLHQVLAGTCPAMRDDLSVQFVRALLRASVQALERVYLDGGPCRWFIPSDVPMLEADVQLLQQLFHSEGDGLPMNDIDAELVRIRKLLQAMSLDTSLLMDLLNRGRGRGAGSVVFRGETLTYEENDALRLLSHRPEWVGSKLLKEEYKIGKKIKS